MLKTKSVQSFCGLCCGCKITYTFFFEICTVFSDTRTISFPILNHPEKSQVLRYCGSRSVPKFFF